MAIHNGFEFNELEARLKMTLDSLSNGGSIAILPEWIAASSDRGVSVFPALQDLQAVIRFIKSFWPPLLTGSI